MEYVVFPIQNILLPIAQDGAARAAMEAAAANGATLRLDQEQTKQDLLLRSVVGIGKVRANKLSEAEIALQCLERLLNACGPGGFQCYKFQ